jgi:hypothetical protein
MITGFFMGWTENRTNMWVPIAKMTWSNKKYYTVCLQGILEGIKYSEILKHIVENKFYNVSSIEVFNEVDTRFSNKMSNTETLYLDRFKPLMEQLKLPDEVNQLSVFEHAARTSSYIFPEVTPDKNRIYHFYFENKMIRGSKIGDYIYKVKIGDTLSIKGNYIYHDIFIVGEAPRYVIDLYLHHLEAIEISVAKVNYHEYDGSLICHLEVNGEIYIPFSDPYYKPLLSLAEVI